MHFTSKDGQLPFKKDSPEVEENSNPDTVVGTILAYDPDYYQNMTFRLDDNAGGRFKLSPNVTCSQTSGTMVRNRYLVTTRRVQNTSWYLKFNGSHFGLPPSSIHRMTGLGGNFVWTITYSHSPCSFQVVCVCSTKSNLDVMEALYIKALTPQLCTENNV